MPCDEALLGCRRVGSAGRVENAAMNCWVGTHRVNGIACCHRALDSGTRQPSHQSLGRRIDGRQFNLFIDGVTDVLENPSSSLRTPSCTCFAVPCPRQDRTQQRPRSPGRVRAPRSGAGTVHGSRQVGPAINASAPRRSATRRASGPLTVVSWIPIVATSAGPTLLACGMRPNVGFSAATPQRWAG